MKKGAVAVVLCVLYPLLSAFYEQPIYHVPLVPGGAPSGIFSLHYECPGNVCAEGKPINWYLTVTNKKVDEIWLWGVQIYDNERKAVIAEYKDEYPFYVRMNQTFLMNATIPTPVVNYQINVSPCLILRPDIRSYKYTGPELIHCYSESYILPMNDCWADKDCKFDESCVSYRCAVLPCTPCQYAQDHICIDYPCCGNQECSTDQICKDNHCVDLTCETNQYIINHTCSDSVCLDNEAIADYSCVPLRCKDNEVPKNHKCFPLNCEEWEEPKNQRCEELHCSENQIYKEHACAPADCGKKQGLVNHYCIDLSCSWYQTIDNRACVFYRSMFRDMLFIVIAGVLLAGLTYSFHYRLKKKEFRTLWQEAMRRKKMKESQKKNEPKT